MTKALHKFQHPSPRRAQYEPHQCTRPNFGATNKLETTLDNSPSITEEQHCRIQQIVGSFLYYAFVVDCNMLTYINTIVEQQSNPTHSTESAITHFQNYAATNPSATIQYKFSDMILHIDSYASYISKPRRRAAALEGTIT